MPEMWSERGRSEIFSHFNCPMSASQRGIRTSEAPEKKLQLIIGKEVAAGGYGILLLAV